MPADHTPSLPTADTNIVDLKPLQRGAGLISGDHRSFVDLLTQRISQSPSAADRESLAHHVALLKDVPGIYRVQQLASLFTHPSRDVRHLALETVGEGIDADPQVKFEAITRMLDQAVLPEYRADALFGILHITDLPTELRFAAAAPFVTDTDEEVRQSAIAVLLKHPEIVDGQIYEQLREIFESAANHEDPRVASTAFGVVQVVDSFYKQNTAINAR